MSKSTKRTKKSKKRVEKKPVLKIDMKVRERGAWRLFEERVQSTKLCDVLRAGGCLQNGALNGEWGVLHLLEETLGYDVVRDKCPLAVSIDNGVGRLDIRDSLARIEKSDV